MGDDDRGTGRQLQHSSHEVLRVLRDDGEDNWIRGRFSSQVGRSNGMSRLLSGGIRCSGSVSWMSVSQPWRTSFWDKSWDLLFYKSGWTL
eukprot:9947203-Karenia_brevis.AAC.1